MGTWLEIVVMRLGMIMNVNMNQKKHLVAGQKEHEYRLYIMDIPFHLASFLKDNIQKGE